MVPRPTCEDCGERMGPVMRDGEWLGYWVCRCGTMLDERPKRVLPPRAVK